MTRVFYILLGAIISWIVQQYRLACSEDVAVINEHVADIREFRDAAEHYWLHAPGAREEDAVLAAKVRARLAAVSLNYVIVSSICGRNGAEYRQRFHALYEAATAGNFESFPRKVDPLRAIAVHDAAARAVVLLRTSRREINSFSRLTKRALARLIPWCHSAWNQIWSLMRD